MREVAELGEPSEARELCSGAGAWQAWCEERWVLAAAARGLAEEELLLGCGTDACRFFVLDQSREPDVLIRIARCQSVAGEHAGDCVSHALLRWMAGDPQAEEIARVAAAPADPVNMPYTVGQAAGCAALPACPPMPRGTALCELGRILTTPGSEACVGPGPTWAW